MFTIIFFSVFYCLGFNCYVLNSRNRYFKTKQNKAKWCNAFLIFFIYLFFASFKQNKTLFPILSPPPFSLSTSQGHALCRFLIIPLRDSTQSPGCIKSPSVFAFIKMKKARGEPCLPTTQVFCDARTEGMCWPDFVVVLANSFLGRIRFHWVQCNLNSKPLNFTMKFTPRFCIYNF